MHNYFSYVMPLCESNRVCRPHVEALKKHSERLPDWVRCREKDITTTTISLPRAWLAPRADVFVALCGQSKKAVYGYLTGVISYQIWFLLIIFKSYYVFDCAALTFWLVLLCPLWPVFSKETNMQNLQWWFYHFLSNHTLFTTRKQEISVWA